MDVFCLFIHMVMHFAIGNSMCNLVMQFENAKEKWQCNPELILQFNVTSKQRPQFIVFSLTCHHAVSDCIANLHYSPKS